MPVIPLTDPADERLAVYRTLKDAQLRERHGRYVAEGSNTIRMLLASDIAIDSLLLTPTAERRLAPDIRAADAELTVYVMEPALMAELVGFSINRGVLASGPRPRLHDGNWLLEGVQQGRVRRICWLDAVHDPWNVGGIVRTARGLGCDCMVLDPGCADPFYRRSIRVSMGHCFHLPLVDGSDSAPLLQRLAAAGVHCFAAECDADAIDIATLPPMEGPWLMAIGNEDRGVAETIRPHCTTVQIPMAPGVVSLNAHVSAGICLHMLRMRERH